MRDTLLADGSIRLISNFLLNGLARYEQLVETITWDDRFRARKSASFGAPYNYSGIQWPAAPFPDDIRTLLDPVAQVVGYEPTNCLANYYPNGGSTMGFHVHSVADVEPGTGITIVSLGAERAISFRRIDDKAVTESYRLPSGSLLHMSPGMQGEWKHAILADPAATGGRISLTFRR